jgi:alginate O-acetyltransferase complex protein AlgI
MLFTNPLFLFLFLPLTFLGFCALKNKTTHVSMWLLFASVVFYIAWNPFDLIPLSVSILVNYGIYSLMFSSHKPKKYLILGISFNLLFLCVYKYSGQVFKKVFGMEALELPLGISFFTFTQIAFLVDHYKNKYTKNDLINYSLFVSYFPHLVCGPIISFKKIYPQLTKKYKISLENISYFLCFFIIGFFKKLVIADPLGGYVDAVFAHNGINNFYTASLGTFAYAIQLFADFSGYSDMAVGISYLFGIRIPDNFDAPYQATSIIDFWRKWHISLSHFLRDYVYIPLGGNKAHQSFNLWITMVIGGLWHGGSWHFIWWGVLHGTCLLFNHMLRKTRPPKANPGFFVALMKKAFVFGFVCVSWIFFKSPNMTVVQNIFVSLVDFTSVIDSPLLVLDYAQKLALFLGVIVAFLLPSTRVMCEQIFIHKKNEKAAYALGAILAFSILYLSKTPHFLYAGF